jgi:hypothetical protein
MPAFEWKRGLRVVKGRHVREAGRLVASRARRAELIAVSGRVAGSAAGRLESGGFTGIRVAPVASEPAVSPRELETRFNRVIECGMVRPGSRVVASLAACSETVAMSIHVARGTVFRRPDELPSFVAPVARNGSVRALERKRKGGVTVRVHDGRLPTGGRVAIAATEAGRNDVRRQLRGCELKPSGDQG